MTQSKVKQTHLERKAIIYVRQSSLHQVEEHTESGRQQYQLIERAQSLGWTESQCELIDDDQTISASQSYNRPGYQRLAAMIARREVGLIVGLEVARLARNCLDWYQLLQIATVFNVLVADSDGVYDLSDFNDRLLLGLKGIFAETELYHMQARLVGARMSKAQRGEYRFHLPVGLEWDEVTNTPRLTVDASVRQAITQVFRLFRQLRSIRAVLHYLRREGLELPYQHQQRGTGPVIGWHQPTYDALYAIVTNPLYAGAYCYGRTETRVDPIGQTVHTQRRPRDEWQAFLPEHYPGYITMDEYEHNQRLLANNAYCFPQSQGAARRGAALLQGVSCCAHCGRHMYVRYSKGQPHYICDYAHMRYGDPVCNRASARLVDGLVAELFLRVVNVGTLELSLTFDDKLRQEVSQIDRGWQQKLQRLDYEAHLARRRYEAVDPDNRLVAHTLETEWNQKLEALEHAREAYATRHATGYELASTLEQMQQVVTHLRDHWFAENITAQDKKELLRCLIEQVMVDGRTDIIHVQVCWYGGAQSALKVPKYLLTAPHVYQRICELARTHTDYTIATILNQEACQTVTGQRWTAKHVTQFRCTHAILSAFTADPALRLPDATHITSAEAARLLGEGQPTIQRWCRLGVLSSQQDGPDMRFWILWNEDVRYRLSGHATPDPSMVSVRALCAAQRKSRGEILAWAQAEGHTIYRLQRGSRKRFFILPHDGSASQKSEGD